jgi:hypothetical protein
MLPIQDNSGLSENRGNGNRIRGLVESVYPVLSLCRIPVGGIGNRQLVIYS